MILKQFELKKINLNNFNYFLTYGKNEGLKKEIIFNIVSKNNEKEIQKFEEKQILDNQEMFMHEVLSGSLFAKERLIIINRCSDKISKIFQEIYEKKIKDLLIIINAENLDKKSKLRNFFEKEKELACIPVYQDTEQILSNLTSKFFKDKHIPISQSSINLIVNKCNGDREFLKNELDKIEIYLHNKKHINNHDLSKLINLSENHSILDLIDNCFVNNSRKVTHILNENNFNSDECILIIRAYLAKAKKILKLALNYAKNKNLEITILEAKPPIFWKEKDMVKSQIQKWSPDKLKKLISNINNIELELKKNSQSSLSILINFIFEQISSKA